MYCILYVYRCTSDMSMYSASERPSKAIPRPPHPYTVSDFQVATKGQGSKHGWFVPPDPGGVDRLTHYIVRNPQWNDGGMMNTEYTMIDHGTLGKSQEMTWRGPWTLISPEITGMAGWTSIYRTFFWCESQATRMKWSNAIYSMFAGGCQRNMLWFAASTHVLYLFNPVSAVRVDIFSRSTRLVFLR